MIVLTCLTLTKGFRLKREKVKSTNEMSHLTIRFLFDTKAVMSNWHFDRFILFYLVVSYGGVSKSEGTKQQVASGLGQYLCEERFLKRRIGSNTFPEKATHYSSQYLRAENLVTF